MFNTPTDTSMQNLELLWQFLILAKNHQRTFSTEPVNCWLKPWNLMVQIDPWRTSLWHLVLLSLIHIYFDQPWTIWTCQLTFYIHSKHYALRYMYMQDLNLKVGPKPRTGRNTVMNWRYCKEADTIPRHSRWYDASNVTNKPTSHSFCPISLIVVIHQVHMCYLDPKMFNSQTSSLQLPKVCIRAKWPIRPELIPVSIAWSD